MIENVDDPTEIKRYRDVVEISQSMFAGNYDDLRNNRKIETESFMMAASPLEKQLTNTLLEKLNELTLNIFNINSEEEVLKIINKKINSLK